MLPLHPGGPDAAGGVTVLGCFSPGARSDPDTSSFLFSSNNLTVAPCSSHSLLHFLFSACLRGNVVRVGGAAARQPLRSEARRRKTRWPRPPQV